MPNPVNRNGRRSMKRINSNLIDTPLVSSVLNQLIIIAISDCSSERGVEAVAVALTGTAPPLISRQSMCSLSRFSRLRNNYRLPLFPPPPPAHIKVIRIAKLEGLCKTKTTTTIKLQNYIRR